MNDDQSNIGIWTVQHIAEVKLVKDKEIATGHYAIVRDNTFDREAKTMADTLCGKMLTQEDIEEWKYWFDKPTNECQKCVKIRNANKKYYRLGKIIYKERANISEITKYVKDGIITYRGKYK